VSQDVHDKNTAHGIGTPGYRAPELINHEERKEYSEKLDVWAMGCIFYEVLFRERAFRDDYEAKELGQSKLEFNPA
jgi:serine/threonine protein kinase